MTEGSLQHIHLFANSTFTTVVGDLKATSFKASNALAYNRDRSYLCICECDIAILEIIYEDMRYTYVDKMALSATYINTVL